MASTRRSELMSPNALPETPLHFFTIILQATLKDKKLMIPKAFVRKFGDELSDVVTLTLPNGRAWHLRLTKDEKNIWFHNGWHEFVKYHSICAGHFLVFKYGKKSNFDVLIFDKSACEIQYPYYGRGPAIDEQNSDHRDGKKIDNSVEMIGFITQKSTCNSSRIKAFDKCRKSSSKRHASPSQLKRGEDNPESSTQDKLEKVKMNSKYYGCALSRKRNVMADERERAINTAKLFEPVNPFCRVVLRPSYLYRGCIMYFPSNFAKKHLRGVSGLIELQTSDGKKRPARCVYRGEKAKLTQGWYEFTLEHNLGEGDVCVFEVLRSSDIVLKVTIFRVLESADFVNQPSFGSALGINRFQKRVASLESPKFKHGNDRQKKRCKIEVLDEIDKLDAVGDKIEHKRAAYKLGQHSRDEENNRTKFDEHDLALLEDMGVSVNQNFKYIAAQERKRAIAAAKLLKPKHPSFMVILQPDNINNLRVYVPSTFGNKYLSKDSNCIKVQDSDGREWPLGLFWSRGFFIKRWAKFYKKEKFGVGDICIFELIRMKDPVLKLSKVSASTK